MATDFFQQRKTFYCLSISTSSVQGSALFLFSSSTPQSAFKVPHFAFDLLKFDHDVSRSQCLKFIILLEIYRTFISLGKFLTFFFPRKTHLTPTPLCPFSLGLYSHIIHITGAFDLSHTLCPLSGLCLRSYFLTPLPVLLSTGKHIRWDLHICYYPLSFNQRGFGVYSI